MKPTNNIPAYRFQGYTDAWELRKLGDEVYFYNGRAYKQSELLDFGKYKVVRVGNFNTNEKWYYSNLELEDSKTIDTGDLIYLWATSFGPEIWKGSKSIYHYHIWKLIIQQVEKIDKNYLYMWLYQDKNKIAQNTNGSTMVHITKKMIESRDFMFPSLPEQEAIGTFFSTIDQHITLHQRKLDMLKEQKKTYLKLLFPAKGQTKPALRFQGFEDDWEEVKLGDVGETFTGLSGKTKEDFGHGEGKFITYVNVFNNPISDLLGTDKIEVDESQTSVQFGDIFFTTSSETPEEVGMSSVWLGDGDNIYLNSFCFGFRPTLKLSNHFMAYVLRSTVIRKKFIFLAQGISRYNISKTKVMNISIPLPTLPEQKAIGTFFQTLDQEITQVEDKLASLKEMKKTLLRKLFVS